jgi:hypothetical protein
MRAPGAVGVALAALLLAGCAAPVGEAPDPAPTEADAGGTSADEGTSSDVAIPPTFPRDDVPLIDGEVAFAVDLGTGWTVVIEADDVAAAYGDAAELLDGAGFETVANDASPDGTFGQFTSEKYTVNVSATDSPDFGNSVSYTVVIAG